MMKPLLAGTAVMIALAVTMLFGAGSVHTASAGLPEDEAEGDYVGELAGLQLVDAWHPGPEYQCPTWYTLYQPLDLAEGTAVEPFPNGAPANASTVEAATTLCQSRVIGVGLSLLIDGKFTVNVQKVTRPEPWSYSFEGEARLSTGAVDGHPVVVVRPEDTTGRGGAFVLRADPSNGQWIVTIVHAPYAPLQVLLDTASAASGETPGEFEASPALRTYLAPGAGPPTSPQDAAVTVDWSWYAGTDYGTSQNSCGWHQGCVSPFSPERGLDWTSSVYPSRAYVNVWGLSPDVHATSRGKAVVSTVRPAALPYCLTTSVTVSDVKTSVDKVTIFYVHSQPVSPGSVFFLYARSLAYNGYWNAMHVGNYVHQSEGSGCYSSGAHSHTWYQTFNGDYSTIPRDLFFNCPSDGGFFFPCSPDYRPNLPHDLSDAAYFTQWQSPY